MAILKKFIGNDQVGGSKILLEPNTALRAATAAGQSQELLKLDSSSVLQLLKVPRVSENPTHDNDVVRKLYVDQEISTSRAGVQIYLDMLDGKITTETQRAIGEETRLEGMIEDETSRALAAEGALGVRIDGEIFRATAREAELAAEIATKIPLAYIGAANGVTPLDAQQKIPTQYLPALAITEVFVVTTLAQRDALVGAGSVQTGDVVKVTEAITAGDGVSKLPRSYIYDGTQYVELSTESDVDSVNGKVGHVSLTTADVPAQGDYQYFTAAKYTEIQTYVNNAIDVEEQARMAEDADIRADFAAEDALIRQEFAAADLVVYQNSKAYADTQILVEKAAREAEDLTLLKLDGSRPMTGALDMDGFNITGINQLNGDGLLALKVGSELSLESHKITNLAAPTAAGDAASKSYVDGVAGAFYDLMGDPNGIATLDAQGKLQFAQIPAIAITDVYVVQNIAARDALIIEEGDVAKVIQAELASDGVTYVPRTYIYAVDNASQIGSWIEIQTESDVMSVAGKIGHVTLDTGDVSEKAGGPFYFTDARAKTAAVVDSIMGGQHDQAPSVFAAKAYIDQEVSGAKTYTDQQLDMLSIAMPEYKSFTLVAQDVTNGYVDLDFIPLKPPLVIRQGLVGRFGYDFSYSGARITFIGEWAVGGLTAIELGDVVEVHYQKSVSPYVQ